MTDLSLNLPEKRLKMKRLFTQSPARIVFFVSIFLLVAAGSFLLGSQQAHEIYADYQIGRAYHVLENADISGQCETRKGIFTNCKATIRNGGKTWKKEFFFFDFSMEKDFTVQAIASDSNPDQVTLDLAAGKIMNRCLMALMFGATGLLCLWMALFALFITLPRVRTLLGGINRADAQPWQLVTVEASIKGSAIRHYFTENNSATRKIPLGISKEIAWLLDVNGSAAHLLAFAPRDGGAAVPFDRKLKAIGGLSKSERVALIAELKRISGN